MTGCQGRTEAPVSSGEGKKERKDYRTPRITGVREAKNPKQNKGMGVYWIYESCFGEKTTDIRLIKYL